MEAGYILDERGANLEAGDILRATTREGLPAQVTATNLTQFPEGLPPSNSQRTATISVCRPTAVAGKLGLGLEIRETVEEEMLEIREMVDYNFHLYPGETRSQQRQSGDGGGEG